MEPNISRLFTDYFFGNWESDMEQHSACVVQRLRPPRKEDAELLGLKRIQEYCEGVVSCASPLDPEPVGFAEGRGAYIREYFDLVVLPLIAGAQKAFRPHARAVGRTASDVTYVIEQPRLAPPPAGEQVLGLHAELYDALASDESSCCHDMCVDFVLVSGKMFHSITPEFFDSLLVAYQFPFGVVLLHKSAAPEVLVVVSYSTKRGMTVLGGAGDPACGVLVEGKPSIRNLSADSRKHHKRRTTGSREEKKESEDDSDITTWYSKPWIHPARSFRRFDDDDAFGRPSSVSRRTTLPSVVPRLPLDAMSSSALINERKCSFPR